MTNSRWTVELQRRAQRVLRRLPRDLQDRLSKAFVTLERDPYNGKKLVDFSLYSYRVGDWRIVYGIEEDRLIVLVIDIGHRNEIYRRLGRL